MIADPSELAYRAYSNAGACGIFPDGSQMRQNCLASVLDPAFTGLQTLLFMAEMVKGVAVTMAPVGLLSAIGCIVTVVCGMVAGTLLTLADVGLNVVKLINGDQSLSDTLLKLGKLGLETLIFIGIGKALSAGFRALKAVCTPPLRRPEWQTVPSGRPTCPGSGCSPRPRAGRRAAAVLSWRPRIRWVSGPRRVDSPASRRCHSEKTETEDDPLELANFADFTGAPHWGDWGDDADWWKRVVDAVDPRSTSILHLNLTGIGEAGLDAARRDTEAARAAVRAFAAEADSVVAPPPPGGLFTNWELRMVRDAPASVRPRVIFYRYSTVRPGPPYVPVKSPFWESP